MVNKGIVFDCHSCGSRNPEKLDSASSAE